MNRDMYSNKDVSSLTRSYRAFKRTNKLKNKFLIENKDLFTKRIRGIFISISVKEDLVMLYGNNKKILAIEENFITGTLKDAMEYIHKDYRAAIKQKLSLRESSVSEDVELKIIDKNNREKWAKVNGKFTLGKNNEVETFEGYLYDITNEKETEIKLEYLSRYDDLTGLLNLKAFKKEFTIKLEEVMDSNKRGVLIIVDLDNFKLINDSYGHACGDALLKKISKELSKRFSKDELVCRFGGDEFLVFIPNIITLNLVKVALKHIKAIFQTKFNINNNEIYSSASIGVSIYPDDASDFDNLLKNADAAMYNAKSNGRDQYKFYSNNISNEINKIYSIQKGLRTALQNKEMFLMFQPKVTLNNYETKGFEALLRWRNKDNKLINPADFIPIAESTRLIVPIGKFVLEEVFIKVKELVDFGYDNFKIAVNLSEVQLREENFLDYFKYLIQKYKVSPKYIELEITESMLMKSVDKNIKALLEMKKLGASIALDDFGTGYSSLNHLTKLPIDVLKIDRSFVIDILNDTKSRYIVESIIQLSHKLGITVVAEGVEEKNQIEYLKSVRCDTVQGFYYSKPDYFENVLYMLKNH